MLYGEHPYGWPSSTAEELLGIEPEQLSAYFREWVRPGDAVLVMAGDVSLDQATDLAEHYLGDWMGDAPAIVDPAPPTGPTGREILILDRPGSCQSSILVGMKALARKHPSHLHLSMLSHIFGGGASGRLFKDLREERSLTYGCSAALDSGAWGGDIVAALSCSPEKTQEAMDALLGQVDRLCGEPVSQKELDEAIQYRVGAWPKAGSSLGGLSRLVLAQVLNSLPEDCWTRFPDELRALGVDALFEVAQTHLSAEDLAVVLVGDAAKLEPACAGLGSLQVRKVEALPPRDGHWAY
jgi:zinc protease